MCPGSSGDQHTNIYHLLALGSNGCAYGTPTNFQIVIVKSVVSIIIGASEAFLPFWKAET